MGFCLLNLQELHTKFPDGQILNGRSDTGKEFFVLEAYHELNRVGYDMPGNLPVQEHDPI